MPPKVLEAMEFGHPVITRPVSVIVDYFVNPGMDGLIESKSKNDYYEAIVQLISHDNCLGELFR